MSHFETPTSSGNYSNYLLRDSFFFILSSLAQGLAMSSEYTRILGTFPWANKLKINLFICSLFAKRIRKKEILILFFYAGVQDIFLRHSFCFLPNLRKFHVSFKQPARTIIQSG
jgi:hypothetical protein